MSEPIAKRQRVSRGATPDVLIRPPNTTLAPGLVLFAGPKWGLEHVINPQPNDFHGIGEWFQSQQKGSPLQDAQPRRLKTEDEGETLDAIKERLQTLEEAMKKGSGTENTKAAKKGIITKPPKDQAMLLVVDAVKRLGKRDAFDVVRVSFSNLCKDLRTKLPNTNWIREALREAKQQSLVHFKDGHDIDDVELLDFSNVDEPAIDVGEPQGAEQEAWEEPPNPGQSPSLQPTVVPTAPVPPMEWHLEPGQPQPSPPFMPYNVVAPPGIQAPLRVLQPKPGAVPVAVIAGRGPPPPVGSVPVVPVAPVLPAPPRPAVTSPLVLATAQPKPTVFKETPLAKDKRRGGGRDGPVWLIVSGFQPNVQDNDLHKVFSKYGKVCEVWMRAAQLAFISFSSRFDCEDAIAALNGQSHKRLGGPLELKQSSMNVGRGKR
eukprot:TRINITY_DN556_c0_g5_i1.p1 TRINITY_DN556_c0_g5~~TRINITY_DN556_c0_g5_i1.p1  ORF type:complete len:449 (+),score=60.61 TRINITY_DN556_c0_g5_i1:57-1349(+)